MSKEDFSAAAEGAKVPKIQRFESAAAKVNIPGECRNDIPGKSRKELPVSIPIESAR